VLDGKADAIVWGVLSAVKIKMWCEREPQGSWRFYVVDLPVELKILLAA